MSVFKEAYSTINKIRIAQLENQIWSDAADSGLPAHNFDQTFNEVGQLVKDHGIHATRRSETNEVNVVVGVIDEWHTHKTEFYRITWSKVKSNHPSLIQKCDGFFTADLITDKAEYDELMRLDNEQMDSEAGV